MCIYFPVSTTHQVFHSHAPSWIGPKPFRKCVLQPTLGPGKDSSDSGGFRPIPLAPTLSKGFEWSIFIDYKLVFATSYFCFRFKQGLLTQLCTGLINNVIVWYNINESNVYGCILNASKAFDLVNHSILFDKLLQCKLSLVITRAFVNWYSDQNVHISWNHQLSDNFSISNWVCQG